MRCKPIVLLCTLLLLFSACQFSTATRSGDRPVFIDLENLTFDTLNVNGQVQLKETRTTGWQALRPGDVFNGFAFVRTGFASNADLVMHEDARTVYCTLGSLLCCTSLRDIYDRVLSYEGMRDYRMRLWGSDDCLSSNSKIYINRSILGSPPPATLLSEAIDNSLDELMKSNTQQAGGSSGGC